MQHSRAFLHAALLAPAALVLVAGLPIQASDLDSRIESTIKGSYNFKAYLAADDISVKSDEGVVTLKGTVAVSYHKALAEETAANTAGVKRVKNELQVKSGEPAEHSDGWISMKVKAVLMFHKNVSATGTDVETTNGVVTLKGQTDSQAQKELTTEYVKDVESVKKVNNQMTVSGAKPHGTVGEKHERTAGEKVDDASITAQVKTSLLFHRSTHALTTKVTTRNGVVHLYGEANNAAEKHLVTKLATDIHGVERVQNHMSVK